MRSLRLRISVALALGQLVVLALATVFAQRMGERLLTEQFDSALRDKAAAYEALIEQEGERVEFDARAALALAPPIGAPRELVQLWKPGARRLYRSPELEDRSLTRPKGTVGSVAIADMTFDGLSLRALQMRVAVTKVESSLWTGPPDEPAVVSVVIARERTDLDRAQASLLTGLLLGDLAILAMAALVAWGLVRRGLAPLGEFGRQVGALDVSTLDGRFDPSAHPREVEPVVAGLNDLRARVDEALRREKRLNATVAHEFRTPISELRAMTAVALQDPDDVEFTRRALEQVHGVSGRLNDLLELIRQMARIERGEVDLERELVHLNSLAADAFAARQETVDARRLQVRIEGPERVTVSVNRAALESVCSNVIGNAVHYAPEGGDVNCVLHETDDGVSLSVTNACSDISPEQVRHLAEPFWRGSASRSDTGHHGLGLSIARGMAELAGLRLELGVRDGTFEAQVTIPEQS